jgi:hypothetical protein
MIIYSSENISFKIQEKIFKKKATRAHTIAT